MANVQFKKGSQTAFRNLQTYTEGTFYLTTDAGRLYYGTGTDSVIELNKSVTTVAAIANLPVIPAADKEAFDGQFYYATAENILCVWKSASNEWVQINPDTNTVNATDAFTLAAADDIATFTHSITDSNTSTKSSTFQIGGANGIKVTASGTKAIITGDTYTLSNGGSGANRTIALASTNTANDSSVAIAAGTNVSFADITGGFSISAIDTTLASLVGASTSTGFTVAATDTAGTVKTATITPTIKLQSSSTPINFVNGVATLDVYSKSQIDSQITTITNNINRLGAMSYRGTVGTGGTSTTVPTANVKVGDTYLFTSAGVYNSNDVKDLIIATVADPVNDVNNNGVIAAGKIVWTLVPSGDDAEIDTTYTIEANDHGLKFKASTGSYIGSFKLQSDNDGIAVSSTGTNDKVITVTHKTNAQPSSSAAAQTLATAGTLTFEHLKGLTFDNYGHVIGQEKQSITVVDTHGILSNATVNETVASNVATLGVTQTFDSAAKGHAFTLGSSSLTYTAASNRVNIDLVWGSF